jgi:hypothetical protein
MNTDDMSEADILIDQLAGEIAAAIGGDPDLYRNAATKIVSEIPEFSMVNWQITVDRYGFACTVTTDAGKTIVISSAASADLAAEGCGVRA